jgi:phosphatidylethanolamine/phosphatidyl-N-methylethanolamine N-methyltransferase
MQTAPRLRTTTGDRAVFLREFLKNPRQIGSVTPSSRFLRRRIVELAETRSAHTVVELGAGTGGTTRAILDGMAPEATLLVVEINPKFCALLERIAEARLVVHCGGAHELRDALLRSGLTSPNVVISGIPFSTIDRAAGSLIVETIWSVLAPGGRFVAYQWSSQVDDLSRPLLGPARVEVELFNVPPLRLYRWEKPALAPAAVEDRRALAFRSSSRRS